MDFWKPLWMLLLHSAQKSKNMNTFENYFINFFHQHIMNIKEQAQKEKNPLFKLIYDIQMHNMQNPLLSTPSRHLMSVPSSAPSRQHIAIHSGT